MVEFALAAADRAEVEAQRREAALLEHVEQIVDDLVVHGAAELRMRMQDDRDRGIFLLRRLISALKTSRWSIENYFRHLYSSLRQLGRFLTMPGLTAVNSVLKPV